MVQPQESSGLLMQESLQDSDLDRIYSAPAAVFSTEVEMRDWLNAHDIELSLADSRKGLSKLFHKIEKGEAKLVYDEPTNTVYRVARAAKISVNATIHGEQYRLVELCQIFLNQPVAEELLNDVESVQVAEVLSKLDIRSAQVRNSQELWETLVADEDPDIGALRGLEEELGLKREEVELATMTPLGSVREYEEPVDWPGISSVLEIHSSNAVLPEEISKPAYAELEGDDQITIFVATPGAPVIRALLAQVLPNIHFVPPLS